MHESEDKVPGTRSFSNFLSLSTKKILKNITESRTIYLFDDSHPVSHRHLESGNIEFWNLGTRINYRPFSNKISNKGQPLWRSGQSVGLGIERSRVRNSLVPSGSSLRQGN